MTKKEARKIINEFKSVQANKRKEKTYKGDWYTVNSIFGNDWAMFYVLLGGREAGKSYSVMKWATINKLRRGDKFKLYWFRLTDTATEKLLANGGGKLVDPDIKRKYNLQTCRKGSTIYTYEEVKRVTKNGNEKIEKKNMKEFCDVLSCSTFYNTKGVGYFDNEFDGEYLLVLDEMNREGCEANRFDIVYNFVNLIENVARSTKQHIRIVMIGNTLDEASDILSAFNFIPDHFGRYKLKSRRCVIDYIKPNEAYLARRKGTAADLLRGTDSTFTNEVVIDRSLLINKRNCHSPSYILKFGKTQDTWFTVWDSGIVKGYNKECCKAFGMRRYLDAQYEMNIVKAVYEQFDSRAFRFVTISDFKRFQKQLRLLKK